MRHRHGCDLPPPVATISRLSDGSRVRIDRCPTCAAVTLHREDTQ